MDEKKELINAELKKIKEIQDSMFKLFESLSARAKKLEEERFGDPLADFNLNEARRDG
jgi:hypothetical protein